MPKPSVTKKSKNALGSELVDAGCRRWPSLPSRTLARKLFHENKGVWSSVDAVRQAVLYRRGRTGARSRRDGAGARGTYATTAPSVPWNPQAFIPPSAEKAFEPHVVSVTRTTKVLVLSDIHIPYHNRAALTAAMEEGRREGCGIILLNGDVLDFYKLSRFQKDPRERGPAAEIAAANHFLDAVDELFPGARKIFKEGNHDERYAHYLMANAPELFSLLAEQASLARLLELEERGGWEYVGDRRPIHLGKLPVIHGHEYPTPVLGPVNAARGLFLRTKACAMVGHHHQTSEHTEGTIKGEMITAWSVGCLCGLHPEYARFNKWNQGAAIITLRPSGDYAVRNFRIERGRVLN